MQKDACLLQFMDFDQFNKQTKTQISAYLKEYLDAWRKDAKSKTPQLAYLIDLFDDCVSGGKMIRGTLVCVGYEMFAKKPNSEIYKIAAAYEIMHGALLIHDDAIDRSSTRRFKKSFYGSLGQNHYAISQSMVMGDLGFFTALEIFQKAVFSEEYRPLALELFLQIISKTILGEGLDVELSEKKVGSADDILQMYIFKTASYTIAGPLKLGAILAGLDIEKLKVIEEFGKNLGIAFQIQDDILGIFGEEKITGKSVLSDIEEGKMTLLAVNALKNGSGRDKEFLEKVYGKKKVTEAEQQRVKSIFISTGAKTICEQKIKRYVESAKKLISNISQDKNHQQRLIQLIDSLFS